MSRRCFFVTAANFLLLLFFSHSAFTWETPSPHQYHIQTDEGPERYFRYQTDSGQYRKEKRLEDGTVVGTYAWIDAEGILRQRDYVADNAGYRILKSKNVFVGRSINVGDAVKAVKKYPADAGTLVKTNQRRPVVYQGGVPSSTYVPPRSSVNYGTTTTARPDVSTTYGSAISTTPTYGSVTTPASVVVSSSTPSVPVVEITPHAYPKQVSTTPSTINFSTLQGNYLPPISTTVSPPGVQYLPNEYSSTRDFEQNSLDYNPYVHQVNNDYRFQNGPTYPLDRNGRPFGDGYRPQYPTYDGVSVTNDGFRYYIPRAYHEEQNLPGNEKSGSFGYIDPFGIRRVIYYNASPGGGFQHKKNNRYVGFDATPYDPRPY